MSLVLHLSFFFSCLFSEATSRHFFIKKSDIKIIMKKNRFCKQIELKHGYYIYAKKNSSFNFCNFLFWSYWLLNFDFCHVNYILSTFWSFWLINFDISQLLPLFDFDSCKLQDRNQNLKVNKPWGQKNVSYRMKSNI